MAQRIDGWTLMARIAAHPHKFDSCNTIAALASLLVVRNQLTQGVAQVGALVELTAIVGQAAMTEVIENLASYEALRIVNNIDGPDPSGGRRTPDGARRRLIDIVSRQAGDHSGSAPSVTPPPRGLEPSESVLCALAPPLRRHRAMGARRIQPTR